MGPLEVRVDRQHKISTTSCQRVVYEDLQPSSGTGTIIIQSDLTHPKLAPILTGHVINKTVLCPSTLYADMAMTAAHYLYTALKPHDPKAASVGLDVCNMEVHKPLVAILPPPADGQHLQLETRASLAKGEAAVTVRSVTWDGTLIQEHGHGLVRYEEDTDTWAETWRRNAYLVAGQVTQLQTKLAENRAHKLLRGIAYKLFDVLVRYAPKYQGMQEVILDKEDTAATAKIRFQVTPADGDYFCSPYFMDNLCHISGFVVNASDVSSANPLVYISHGWESLKFLRPTELSAEKEYTSYVRMIPQGNNVSAGDVYVFEGEEIIAVLYGLKFQGIPQRLMDVLLPPGRNKKQDSPLKRVTKKEE